MSALTQALPLLSIVAGGVIALATFARDPKASQRDEHDVSDYREPAPLRTRGTLAPERRNWPLPDQKRTDYTWGRADILPPAPEGMDAGSPLYAAMLFDTWFPETAEDTAARFLREIRDEALAGAR